MDPVTTYVTVIDAVFHIKKQNLKLLKSSYWHQIILFIFSDSLVVQRLLVSRPCSFIRNKLNSAFLPHDVMIARHMMSSCVFLCLSFCHRLALYQNDWADPAGMDPYLPSIFEYTGISIWNFVSNSALRKFRHEKSIVLSTKLVDGRAC